MPIYEDPERKRRRELEEEERWHWEMEEAARREQEEREAEEDKARESAIGNMREWFFEQFEDPANDTPWDGEDKRYIFVFGGPYEANDILPSQFGSDYPEEWVLEAVELIEQDGIEWAPSSHGDFYLHPEDEERLPSEDVETSTQIAVEIKARIDELEKLLTGLPKAPSSLGHNMPPEEIGSPPYTDETETDVRAYLGSIQQELDTEEPNRDTLLTNENGLRTIAAKIISWVGQKADLAVDETVRTGVKAGIWGTVGIALLGVAEKVAEYIVSLG